MRSPIRDLRLFLTSCAALSVGLSAATAFADDDPMQPEPPAASTTAPPEANEPSDPEPAAPVTAASWADALTAHAFVSFGYTFNANRPDSNVNGLRVFDVTHNGFTLDVAELSLLHSAASPGDVGFRVDLVAGQTVPPASSAVGLFKSVDDMGNVTAQNFDLQQAYATWVAPVGNGLRIDGGKWLSPMSAEVIEGWDGFGDNYSHTWLFGFAMPYSHTGVRLSYPVSGAFTLTGAVVNGWDNALDNNDGKSLMLGGALTVAPSLSVALTYVGGPEQNGNNDDLRHMVDAALVFKKGMATLTAEGDFGFEEAAASGGMDSATWYGGAGYLKLDLSSSFALTGRLEYFADPDGVRTGTAQNLIGATVTPAYHIGSSFVLRGDLRLDHSDEDVFARQADVADEPTANQITVGLNMLASY